MILSSIRYYIIIRASRERLGFTFIITNIKATNCLQIAYKLLLLPLPLCGFFIVIILIVIIIIIIIRQL